MYKIQHERSLLKYACTLYITRRLIYHRSQLAVYGRHTPSPSPLPPGTACNRIASGLIGRDFSELVWEEELNEFKEFRSVKGGGGVCRRMESVREAWVSCGEDEEGLMLCEWGGEEEATPRTR